MICVRLFFAFDEIFKAKLKRKEKTNVKYLDKFYPIFFVPEICMDPPSNLKGHCYKNSLWDTFLYS
jgi:hypothetical protein